MNLITINFYVFTEFNFSISFPSLINSDKHLLYCIKKNRNNKFTLFRQRIRILLLTQRNF